MDFTISKDEEILRQSVRNFAENVLGPGVVDRDEKEYYDPNTFKAMADLGLMGIPFEEKWGGADMGMVAYALAIEEIARIDASAADTFSAHVSLCAFPIRTFGTDWQRHKYLIPLTTGEAHGAFALTEPNAGSDVLGMTTKAELKGNQYVLNGRKIFITNGAAADTYIVFARTGAKESGSKAFSAFIVEKGTPGFSFGKYERKMGLRGTQNCDLVFEDCCVSAENLLGQPGQGFKIAMQALDGGRIGIAAQAVGIAQGAMEQALEYAKTRVQFGRPIAKQQAIAFKLADMAVEIDAARMLTYRAAWRKGQGMSYSMEAAMAKLKASETAMRVTNQAVQIHGGYGYTREYPVERMMRDAKITELYEGTSEIQRVVISNNLVS